MDLDTYIDQVKRSVGGDSPLEAVAQAVALGQSLNAWADQLIDHFVGIARTAGHSWAEIGGAMGVTKQAAQQRFVAPSGPDQGMERISRKAREAIARSSEEARSFRHGYVGTEHILLALLADDASIGAKALIAEGISYDAVRAEVESRVGPGKLESPVAGILPFTARARGALKMTLREAVRMGQNYVGTEQILTVLAADEKVLAGKILRDLGTGPDELRTVIGQLLANLGPEEL